MQGESAVQPIGLMNSIAGGFSNSVVVSREGSSHGSAEDVDVDAFLDSFQSLTTLLKEFGRAFYFVELDVGRKIKTIRKKQADIGDKPEANHVLDLVQLEIDTNVIAGKESCGRNFLRLQRALKFIYLFFEKLGKDQDLRVSAEAAYAASLFEYQGWAVRKTVSLAFYTLPSKEAFMAKLADRADQTFEPFVDTIKRVYTILNTYYDTKDLQHLN